MSDFDWGVLVGFAIGAVGTLVLVTVFEVSCDGRFLVGRRVNK